MPQLPDVPHPGEHIRDELAARGWSQRDLAYVLGMPEQSVTLLVSGKRGITADMANALGDAFDVPPETFMNLQKAYELARARTPDPAIKRKGRLQGSYPVREMIKRGWLVDVDADALERQMAHFFEVSNTDDIPHVAHAAKKTDYDDAPRAAQVAWLYRVRQIAREMVVAKYSEKALRVALPRLQALTSAPEETRHVPHLLTECGIRFVVVEGLPGGKIDGVCSWLDNGTSPVIGMSVRFDRIDNFWFVLRHEIEHVLRGDGKELPVIDAELEGENAGTGAALPEPERVANAAALDFCVPTERMSSFIARKQPFFSERDLLAFAKTLGVHPGLVAGQIRSRTQNWKVFTKHLAKVRGFVTSVATVDGWGEIAPVST
jgi:HTH-type transcriptional regulator/antitoxin HigA